VNVFSLTWIKYVWVVEVPVCMFTIFKSTFPTILNTSIYILSRNKINITFTLFLFVLMDSKYSTEMKNLNPTYCDHFAFVVCVLFFYICNFFTANQSMWIFYILSVFAEYASKPYKSWESMKPWKINAEARNAATIFLFCDNSSGL
jgi:hypothetical protein